uniref:Uncharacterized protein n=1 Tax=Anas zonorhyncha TaxID=75864 RepID=A0A8B9UB44_9AVES
ATAITTCGETPACHTVARGGSLGWWHLHRDAGLVGMVTSPRGMGPPSTPKTLPNREHPKSQGPPWVQPHLNVLAGDILHHGWEEVRGIFAPGNHLGNEGAA